MARTENEKQFLEGAMLHALDEAAQSVYRAGQCAKLVGLDTTSLWNEYQRLLAGRKSLEEKVLVNRNARLSATDFEYTDDGVYMAGDDFND